MAQRCGQMQRVDHLLAPEPAPATDPMGCRALKICKVVALQKVPHAFLERGNIGKHAEYIDIYIYIYLSIYLYLYLLFGGWPTPLEKIWKSVGMMKFPMYGKKHSCSKPPISLLFSFIWTTHAMHWCPGNDGWYTLWTKVGEPLEGTAGQTGLVLDLVLNLSMKSKYSVRPTGNNGLQNQSKKQIVSTHISMRVWIKIQTPKKTLN